MRKEGLQSSIEAHEKKIDERNVDNVKDEIAL